jgi:dolichol-phosphate mannosyltransferase/undecaprenyl-phosphate 4-deoxy-4-formamido-L-arabinose transferase
MKNSSPEFSIVIPVYNTVIELSELVVQIKEVFTELIHKEYEIIFIDDFSPNPDTWNELIALTNDYSTVKAVRLMKNFGQHSATLCGLKLASGNIIITMDDDFQHDPADIPKLIAESAHDIVIAQLQHKKHSFFKRLTSNMKGWFDTLILGKPRGLQLSSFRLMKKEVATGILSIETSYPFLPALMFYVTKDVVGVNLEHHARQIGDSGYSLFQLIRLFSNLLVNNSSLLLQSIGIIGIICSIISLVTALYFIIQKVLFDIPVAGWTSVIVTTLFLGGINLFSIGIIGEYLIRIIKGVEKKPAYFIREII